MLFRFLNFFLSIFFFHTLSIQTAPIIAPGCTIYHPLMTVLRTAEPWESSRLHGRPRGRHFAPR